MGKEVKNAIIVIPTYFTKKCIEEIRDTAALAELNILYFLRSSTTAGLAYCYERNDDVDEKNYIIFDLGSGTLNLSLIIFEDGLVEERSVNGNINLGGQDFTNRIIKYCISEFRRKTGIYIRKNDKAMSRIILSCENAKKTLSFSTEAEINLENLFDGEDLLIKIKRSYFEDSCLDLFKKCIPPLQNLLWDGKISKSQINEIILVGGSSRIPKIQEMLIEFLNGKNLIKV